MPSPGARASTVRRPPRPPTTTATTIARAISAPASMSQCWPPAVSSATAIARDRVTNGVAIPSFRPLSMLIARRIRTGIARSSSTGRLSAASVGARIDPMTRAKPTPSAGNRSHAMSAPPAIVNGNPIASSRPGSHAMPPASRSPIVEASENRRSARVSSASTRNGSNVAGAVTAPTPAGPRSAPTVTRTIGPLIESRSRRTATSA